MIADLLPGSWTETVWGFTEEETKQYFIHSCYRVLTQFYHIKQINIK